VTGRELVNREQGVIEGEVKRRARSLERGPWQVDIRRRVRARGTSLNKTRRQLAERRGDMLNWKKKGSYAPYLRPLKPSKTCPDKL